MTDSAAFRELLKRILAPRGNPGDLPPDLRSLVALCRHLDRALSKDPARREEIRQRHAERYEEIRQRLAERCARARQDPEFARGRFDDQWLIALEALRHREHGMPALLLALLLAARAALGETCPRPRRAADGRRADDLSPPWPALLARTTLTAAPPFSRAPVRAGAAA